MSSTVLESVEKVIAQILACPPLAVQLVTHLPSTSCKLPEDISDLICQRFRASFDKIDTAVLTQMTKENYYKNSKLVSHWSNEAMQNYLKESSAVTWQMAIQKPPMKLADNHTSYDEMKHRLWWTCSQSKARKIDFTIWPVLYDYDGGNLLVKGCVHAS